MALTTLLLALSAAACVDAESAGDEHGVRMIPPAEEPVEPAAEAEPPGSPGPVGAGEVAGEPPAVAEEPAADVPDVDGSDAPEGRVLDGGTAASGDGAPARPRTVRRTEADERPLERAPREGELERTDPAPLSSPEAFERRTDPTPAPPVVPAGTRLELVMETGLSTGENRAGDAFRASLVEDVLGADGLVLLPRDARVGGRVLESRESEASDRPAVLTLLVETVEVDGVPHPVVGTVEEVEMDTAAREGTRQTATKVGVGAAAGAVLGKILGSDSKDALKGAAVGAAAGAAVALATRSGHATISEGARLAVRLDEPLALERGGAGDGWRERR